jgi:hypothetical protein
VCHTCDVRHCVNPAHLFVGTKSDNMRDMLRKGRDGFRTKPERWARGARQGKAKLTDDAIREIRRSARPDFPRLMEKFGVCRSTIEAVFYRADAYWAHVKP